MIIGFVLAFAHCAFASGPSVEAVDFGEPYQNLPLQFEFGLGYLMGTSPAEGEWVRQPPESLYSLKTEFIWPFAEHWTLGLLGQVAYPLGRRQSTWTPNSHAQLSPYLKLHDEFDVWVLSLALGAKHQTLYYSSGRMLSWSFPVHAQVQLPLNAVTFYSGLSYLSLLARYRYNSLRVNEETRIFSPFHRHGSVSGFAIVLGAKFNLEHRGYLDFDYQFLIEEFSRLFMLTHENGERRHHSFLLSWRSPIGTVETSSSLPQTIELDPEEHQDEGDEGLELP